MKILHTSDWHLGRTLYHKKRHEESAAFFDWLLETIHQERIDVLLVAGDVFDTTTPGTRAQELYYGFLGRVRASGCRHVIITGGNHDSPAFLNAPGAILRSLNVHVVGSATDDPGEEVLAIRNDKGGVEAIVCAVPFLRDRDVRQVEEGESPGDKSEKLLQGIAGHYRKVVEKAQEIKRNNSKIPVIGMGHLFTKMGKTSEGDGVRDLYIGTAGHIDTNSISDGFDYMALGHLHIAQKAGGNGRVRYSGSPFPMSFSEANQEKKVVVIEFSDKEPHIREIAIPSFRRLISLSGTVEEVGSELEELVSEEAEAWVEVEITNPLAGINITEHFNALINGSMIEIIRIKNLALMERTLHQADETETLENLEPSVVFDRCMESAGVSETDRTELLKTYQEAIFALENSEINE